MGELKRQLSVVHTSGVLVLATVATIVVVHVLPLRSHRLEEDEEMIQTSDLDIFE